MRLINKSLLATAVIALAAVICVSGQDSRPRFEVASVKSCSVSDRIQRIFSPGRMTLPCAPVGLLIRDAYITFANGKADLFQGLVRVEGGPKWIDTDLYSVSATAEGSVSSGTMMGPVLQSVLEDRFQLKIHHETREGPAYAVTVAKGGAKLQPTKEENCIHVSFVAPLPPVAEGQEKPNVCKSPSMKRSGAIWIIDEYSVTLDQFSKSLGNYLDRPGINQTGISGLFDIHLEIPFEGPARGLATTPDAGGPTIFTAIQEQLGLKLESARGPVEVLVIDNVSKLTEN